MKEKLKSFLRNDAYFMALLIILVGVGSYGLGRLSVVEKQVSSGAGESMVQIESLETQDTFENKVEIPVVVSKSGTKYHLFDCPGALQMKKENRIEFGSFEEAEAAGYSPAANCPGLK